MTTFNREKWINEECVYTYRTACDMCPYVVVDHKGHNKCEKEMYEECQGVICD